MLEKYTLLHILKDWALPGSTFYDDEVTDTFLPHADQKSVIIAIGIGIPAYLAKSGKIYTNVLNKEDYS